MRRALAAGASMLVCSWATLAAPPLTPEDFAYAMRIEVDGQDALYQLRLPLAVYQSTTRGDLGDLRVFNQQGEVVPHGIGRVEPSVSRRAPVSVPLFPLYGSEPGGLEGINVEIERDGSETVVGVTSSEAHAPSPKLLAYIIDTSRVQGGMQALRLDWETSESYVAKVTVETSDDLNRWSTVVSETSLVELDYAGHELEQKRIELPPTTAKYLRISWPAGERATELASAFVVPGNSVVEAAREWIEAKGEPSQDAAGVYDFDAGAHVPADRLRVALPESNTLIEAEVYARSKLTEEWSRATAGVFYSLLRDGREWRSADVVLGARRERHWQLRVDQKGGGIGAGAPVLELGWTPQRLVFIARGDAPFQLAYGAHGVASAELPIESLLRQGTQDSTLPIKEARLGDAATLGGPDRLVAPAPPLPWKQWTLWAVLVLGVALLGWMALRLMKQMQVPPAPDEPP